MDGNNQETQNNTNLNNQAPQNSPAYQPPNQNLPETSTQNVPSKAPIFKAILISMLIVAIVVSSLYLVVNVLILDSGNNLTNSPAPTPISTGSWETYTNEFIQAQLRHPADWDVSIDTERLEENLASVKDYIVQTRQKCPSCYIQHSTEEIAVSRYDGIFQEVTESSSGRQFIVYILISDSPITTALTIRMVPPGQNPDIPFSDEQKLIAKRIVSTFNEGLTEETRRWKDFNLQNLTFKYPDDWQDPQYQTSAASSSGTIASQDNSNRITVTGGVNAGAAEEDLVNFLNYIATLGGKQLEIQGNPAAQSFLTGGTIRKTDVYILAPDRASLFRITLEASNEYTDEQINALLDGIIISTITFTN